MQYFKQISRGYKQFFSIYARYCDGYNIRLYDSKHCVTVATTSSNYDSDRGIYP